MKMKFDVRSNDDAVDVDEALDVSSAADSILYVIHTADPSSVNVPFADDSPSPSSLKIGNKSAEFYFKIKGSE